MGGGSQTELKGRIGNVKMTEKKLTFCLFSIILPYICIGVYSTENRY